MAVSVPASLWISVSMWFSPWDNHLLSACEDDHMVPRRRSHRVTQVDASGYGRLRHRARSGCRGVLDQRSQMGQRAGHGDIPVPTGLATAEPSVCLGVGDSMELSLASGS